MYLDQMPPGEHTRNFSGKRLDPTVFEKVRFLQKKKKDSSATKPPFFELFELKMSPEQLGQLYELMHAAKDVWKPVSEGKS